MVVEVLYWRKYEVDVAWLLIGMYVIWQLSPSSEVSEFGH